MGCEWRKPVQISPASMCLSQSHDYTLLLLQADGQPALLPGKQRPPMSTGLSFLPFLMLTLPGKIPQVSNTALIQETAKHNWVLLLHCTSVFQEGFPLCSWSWSYLCVITLNHTNTLDLLPPTAHTTWNSLKMFFNTSGIFRPAVYGRCAPPVYELLINHLIVMSWSSPR